MKETETGRRGDRTKRRHWLYAIIFIAVSVLICWNSVVIRWRWAVNGIYIDCARPNRVVAPSAIVPLTQRGERGFYIGPDAPQGWRDQTAEHGHATYRFEAPQDGEYWCWAYALWQDACTDAVFVQVNNTRRTTLGKDGVYARWHWVRGARYKLTKGSHTVTLANHSNTIGVLQLCMLNSSVMRPETNRPNYIDLFRDSFDGCAGGKFADWQVMTGKWNVEPASSDESSQDNVIVGNSTGDAVLFYDGATWAGYRLNVSIRPTDPQQPYTAGVRFAVRGDTNYYELRIESRGLVTQRTARLLRQIGDDTINIGEFPVGADNGDWTEVEVVPEKDDVAIRVDGSIGKRYSWSDKCEGGIAVCVYGNKAIAFDNVLLRQAVEDSAVESPASFGVEK